MSTNSRFTEDGWERLRTAVKKQVREDFQTELAASTEHWSRVEIESKIEDEIRRRMKELASPQSLWSSS